jgi:hypothetical protein
MHRVLVVFEDLAKRHVQIFISKDEHNCCEIENLPAVDLVERVQPVADVDEIPEGVVCTRRLLEHPRHQMGVRLGLPDLVESQFLEFQVFSERGQHVFQLTGEVIYVEN